MLRQQIGRFFELPFTSNLDNKNGWQYPEGHRHPAFQD